MEIKKIKLRDFEIGGNKLTIIAEKERKKKNSTLVTNFILFSYNNYFYIFNFIK